MKKVTKKQMDAGVVADMTAQFGAIVVADEFGDEAMWHYDPVDVWDVWLQGTYDNYIRFENDGG
jgi:hypothetical protein